MANNFTDSTAHKVLDKVFGGTDFTPPTNFYVALMSVRPANNGTGGTEFSGNGYDRVQVVNNVTNFPNASARAKSNGTSITFPIASGNQGTAVCVALFDASVAGTIWALSNPISLPITTNMEAYFDIGDLVFTIL